MSTAKFRSVLPCVGAVAGLLLLSTAAKASTLDLTTAGTTGNFGDGALYTEGGTLSGTGVFPAFVQVKTTGTNLTEQGYNTTVNNVNDNGPSDTFNHEITVSDLQTVHIGTTDYYKFELDINEASQNNTDAFLSLDNIVILTSTTKNQSSTPLPAGTTRYNLDAVNDNSIVLNFLNEPGSGKYDMNLFVPVSNFSGALATDFVYLYSAFGGLGTVAANTVHGFNDADPGGIHFIPAGVYSGSDGFEEWALNPTAVPCPPTDPACGPIGGAVPEPASLLLLGSGLAAFSTAAARRRANKKDSAK